MPNNRFPSQRYINNDSGLSLSLSNSNALTGKSIIDLLLEQAKLSPDAIAVIFEDRQLTYQQLFDRVNHLAQYLRQHGVKAETLVPVCIERGLDMLIGILGVLMSGGAYVPIDPAYPDDRMDYILADTNAALILCSKATGAKLTGNSQLFVIELDADWEKIQQAKAVEPPAPIKNRDLAYVIYTSGSTGKPKGVMITRHNLFSFIAWCHEEFSNSHFNIVYAVTSICFDLSVFELFYPLSIGKPVRILNNALDVTKCLASDTKVLLNTIPSVIHTLLATNVELGNVSVLNLAGEPVTTNILNRLDTDKIEVRNLYGPTEDTTYSTVFRLRQGQPILIGKPVANTQVYIVDKAGELITTGESGEICLGGSGLARGYLNQDTLTKEKFIDASFINGAKTRIYKTGDLGRVLTDGNIAYLGRIDDQVKIRGYRIELGEIESVLTEFEHVKQAIVLAKADHSGDKRLVAYVVPLHKFDKQKIISHLKANLPEYMLPALFVEVDKLPLLPNGKIDRQAIPDPDMTALTANYVAPRNNIEVTLAKIWQSLLGVRQIGVNDNFLSLGGHSLLAMRMICAIRQELGIELTIGNAFIYPVLGNLSAYLATQNTGLVLPAVEVITPRPENVPLSFSQESLWFIDQLQGSQQYHIPMIFRLQGKLHITALEATFKKIVNRHQILRTVIIDDADSQAFQQLLPQDSWKLDHTPAHHDWANPESLSLYVKKIVNRPFNMRTDHMLRVNLIDIGDGGFMLVLTLHHIASDGWSNSILFKEITEIYAAIIEGREPDLPVLSVQYSDFAIWQRKYLKGDLLDTKLAYWKSKLNGFTMLQLPSDGIRTANEKYKCAVFDFKVENELLRSITALSQSQGVTLYMTLLSAFKILLYRYTGQEDICIGTVAAGRHHLETEGLIGLFANSIVIRSKVSGDNSFIKQLAEIKKTTLEAYEHQDAPFEKVVEVIMNSRDISRNPLFQVMFILQNTPEVPDLRLNEIGLETEQFTSEESKLELIFSLTETKTGIAGSIEYSTDLYSQDRIERMVDHYKVLLNSIIANTEDKIEYLQILTAEEKNALLYDFNKAPANYPDKNIVALFESQVANTPNLVAVCYEGQQITYLQLNEKANQLALHIQKSGVQPKSLIPVCAERGLNMIIGILGILKAGGAYVPIDPDYPKERITYMLNEIGSTLLLSNKRSRKKLKLGSSINVIELDGDWDKVQPEQSGNLNIDIKPCDLAYVMYTSGSTGKPKGAMIEHHSVVSLVKEVNYVNLQKDNILLATGSPSFDASIFEYWGMLLNGGKLILCSLDDLLDSEKLRSNVTGHKVKIMWFTASWFNQLVDNNPEIFAGLNTVLVGGEKISEQHVEILQSKYQKLNIINGYGPTENTTFSLTYAIDKINVPVPIGVPLNNRKAYVLTPSRQLCPIGIPGEICVGGAGLARGYLNHPKLTDEKFITDPFDNTEARLYLTGDVGKWLPDGNIAYLGRIDDQVKIRGYRVELGEIETVLLQSRLVRQAHIIVKQDKLGNNRLVGYVVPFDGLFDKAAIQVYLHKKLPEYMVPLLWVTMDSMPLTSNGKINKNELPEPEMSDMFIGYAAPRSEIEKALANIWQEMLGVDRIGIYDNFFELGGYSILAMRMVSAIRKKLMIELAIKDIFTYPFIAGLAWHLNFNNSKVSGSLIPIKTSGDKAPLYIVCGAGGTVFKFRDFANMLDADQPVYGLQQPTENSKTAILPDTIELIAAGYIKEILSQNPDGPYALSGHCLGGIIAFEMAVQLSDMGKKVSMLAMFDAVASSTQEIVPHYFNDSGVLAGVRNALSKTLLKIKFELFLLKNYPKQALLYKLNKLRLILGDQYNRENEDIYAFNQISLKTQKAAGNYVIKHYEGDIIVFYAKEHYYFIDRVNNVTYKELSYSDDIWNAWKRYARSVEIFEVDGEHSNMFDKKYADKLAKMTQQHLDDAVTLTAQ